MALYDLTCKAYFGADVQFPPNVVDTNFEYGGLDVSADNVTYVHGSLDPWHSIGVADGTDLHSSSVYYIENGSHCNDAFNPDLVFLSDSVKKVQEWIEFDIQWYLQGTPWAHHTVEDSEVSSVHAASAKWGGPPADTCGFDVVLKRTRTNVKYGDQIKVQWWSEAVFEANNCRLNPFSHKKKCLHLSMRAGSVQHSQPQPCRQ